jgi:tol-pal system-associated acyl-CoA thioesterase
LEHQDQPTRVQPWPVRVYYHHTDAGGVVYHGTYLDFFEAARIELLHACGFDLVEVAETRHAMFIVYRIKVDYHKPARLNDRLAVTAEIGRVGRARVIFDQRVLRGAEVLVSAAVEAACVHPRTLRPVPLPDEVRERLEALA